MVFNQTKSPYQPKLDTVTKLGYVQTSSFLIDNICTGFPEPGKDQGRSVNNRTMRPLDDQHDIFYLFKQKRNKISTVFREAFTQNSSTKMINIL